MGCRIGMATNVAARIQRLKNEGVVPDRAKYRTVKRNLTYEEANQEEIARRKGCSLMGKKCEGSPGGGYKPGRVWSVYRIDW